MLAFSSFPECALGPSLHSPLGLGHPAAPRLWTGPGQPPGSEAGGWACGLQPAPPGLEPRQGGDRGLLTATGLVARELQGRGALPALVLPLEGLIPRPSLSRESVSPPLPPLPKPRFPARLPSCARPSPSSAPGPCSTPSGDRTQMSGPGRRLLRAPQGGRGARPLPVGRVPRGTPQRAPPAQAPRARVLRFLLQLPGLRLSWQHPHSRRRAALDP